MKIVFTGGGSGGHFYPLIAVAEEIRAIAQERNLIKPELYYFSNSEYDAGLLFEQDITYKHVSAGKMRTYVSLKNATDLMKTMVGVPSALSLLFRIWPDVVFTKGGYPSVPVVTAARILGIPVVVHDSDAVPGRANIYAGKFAARVAISYPEAAKYFPHEDRVALTGNPIRRAVQTRELQDAHAHFGLSPDVATLLVLGGSQGAEHINTMMLKSAPLLLQRYQIIHGTGPANYEAYKELVEMELTPELRSRYRIFPNLPADEYRIAAGAAHLIISRAGSGTIFEIAAWEVPSILIPIPEDISRDQRQNAYAYARTGAALVIEQENCAEHLLQNEVDRLINNHTALDAMRAAARSFKRPDAAHNIALEIMRIALKHEV